MKQMRDRTVGWQPRDSSFPADGVRTLLRSFHLHLIHASHLLNARMITLPSILGLPSLP